MECNKEEATRARSIAESKMQSNDYVGARKIVLKAQQLFPELENISHILSVCDVHCAARVNSGVPEKDWYGILQVDVTADDNAIRKQYRKLALLLHPDKNKFCGAEAAFKLIVEAQRTLLDKQKRMEYNKKINAAIQHAARKFQSHPVNGVQKNSQTNHVVSRPRNTCATTGLQQAFGTFWTWCPACGTQYQYYLYVIGKAIRCPKCLKPFIANDVRTRPVSNAPSQHEQKVPPVFQEEKVVYGGVDTRNIDQQAAARHSSYGNLGQPHIGTKVTDQTEFSSKSQSAEAFSGTRCNVGADEMKVEGCGLNGKSGNGAHSLPKRPFVGGSNTERKEPVISDEGKRNVQATTEFNSSAHQNKLGASSCHPRRTERAKQHVEYSEESFNVDEDDDLVILSPKRAKIYTTGSEALNDDVAKPEKEATGAFMIGVPNRRSPEYADRVPPGGRDGGSVKLNDCIKGRGTQTCQNAAMSYLEPEFYDFDQDRTGSTFRVDQIWALYDDQEGMPRFYAMIKKIDYSPLKIYFTWLEPLSTRVNSGNSTVGVRVACGRFKLGDTGNSDIVSMFSHLVSFEKAVTLDIYFILPKKGDVWALFKSINDPKTSGYEIVEVLSDYSEEGVQVTRLEKVKDFVCLFQRRSAAIGVDTFRLSPEEMLRFSHNIPMYRLSGKERRDLPSGSIELDPAALPAGLEEFDIYKPSEEAIMTHQNPEPYMLPATEFHDFEKIKSIFHFRVGQFWALYSEEDGMPKYYAQVENVDTVVFSITVRWFEVIAGSKDKDVSRWSKMGIPIGCGNFKLGGIDIFDTTHTFSHQVYPLQYTKIKFAIYPKKFEIWAVFKNWRQGWSVSDVMDSEYELVEIKDVFSMGYRVLVLEKVRGFRYVYMAVGSEKAISMNENLCFSHQVPAFHLSDERCGRLRGSFEVDPAALPEPLLSLSLE